MAMKLFPVAFVLTLSVGLHSVAVDRGNMFKHVVGVDEDVFRSAPERFFTCALPGSAAAKNLILNNGTTGRSYRCGDFSLHTLQDLRTMPAPENTRQGSFKLVRGARVERLMADPAYAGATFQVASRPHTLEAGDSFADPRVSDTLMANPQGQTVGRCVMPSYIARAYGMVQDGPINLFRHYPDITVDAGGNVEHVPNFAAQAVGPDYTKKMQVAFVRGAQVVFGFGGEEVHGEQLVNLALCSAIALSGYNDPAGNRAALARLVLHAMMEATLRAAAAHGSKRVVLTPLGCGVFGNNAEWLCDAIAAQRDFIKSAGLQVELALFDDVNLAVYQALEARMNGSDDRLQGPSMLGSKSAAATSAKAHSPLPATAHGSEEGLMKRLWRRCTSAPVLVCAAVVAVVGGIYGWQKASKKKGMVEAR